ncbi:hypothetical protein HMPREF1147_1343 [Selenomonas sp. FOBRC9]|uniref:hypothetical protein n=1 Tax=Selenomonas sp. FOBRC9 TaxID=936573 RepID=UPI00027A632A|nr:hypothetical protein [Selenomonas sp. FOBRC9]EJP32306.1 hypothetical protein HMPREF1147_1343 [Selenomonas sp. FOBRC9]
MPETNEGDVTKAPARRGRLYGRKWKILIYKPAYKIDENGSATDERDPEHDTEMDVSMLKCEFQTKTTTETAVQIGTLVVYNMNAATEKEAIEEGFQISIFGGYEEGQYGEIFTGDIVQIFRNRENGTDYRLEIIAIKGMISLFMNHVRSTIAAGSTPRDVVNAVAGQADKKIGVGEVSEELPAEPLPRGKVLFGTPAKYLRDICTWNDAAYWEGEDGKLTIETVEQEIPEDRVLVLTPNTGLVGTPIYTDQGIQIKMLLDPRVKLRTMIKIDNEIIQRQAIQIDPSSGQQMSDQLPQTAQFDQDGEYQVFSVEHHGDTWGDEWTTSVIGVSRNGRMGLLTTVNGAGQTMK